MGTQLDSRIAALNERLEQCAMPSLATGTAAQLAALDMEFHEKRRHLIALFEHRVVTDPEIEQKMGTCLTVFLSATRALIGADRCQAIYGDLPAATATLLDAARLSAAGRDAGFVPFTLPSLLRGGRNQPR